MSTMSSHDSTTDDEFLGQFNIMDHVEKLAKREVTIGSVIENLAPVFTSNDVKTRTKSYEILRDILDQLSEVHLNQDEVKVIAIFLNQRLKHENSAIPVVIQTAHILCHKYDLPDVSAVELYDVLAKEVVVQQQQVTERFKIYQTIAKLIKTKGEILARELKLDFIINFIRIIEGERDPRCLLLNFQLFREVITNYDVGHMDEDAFEMISCYFPIAYNQPKNDPYNIARSDLASALNACLSSSSKFAKFGLPLITEKLSSDLESAKIDSYDALSVCCAVYGWTNIKPFMSLIWNYMRKDVLKVGDFEPNDLINSALKALSSLVMELSNDKATMEYFLNDLMKDIEPGLVKSDLHLRPAAVEIVIASTPNLPSFQFLFERVTRFLLEGASRDTQYNSKCFLLKCLECILKSKQILINETSIQGPIEHQSALISLSINNLKQETDVFPNISDNDAELINDCLFVMFKSCSDQDMLNLIAKIFREMQISDRLTVSSALFQILNKAMNFTNDNDNCDDCLKVVTLLDHCWLPAMHKLQIVHDTTMAMIDSLNSHQRSSVVLRGSHFELVSKVIATHTIPAKELSQEDNDKREEDVTKQILEADFIGLLMPNMIDSIYCSVIPVDVLEGCLEVFKAFIKQAKMLGSVTGVKKLIVEIDEPTNRCTCPVKSLEDIPQLKLLHPVFVSLKQEDIDGICLKKVDEQLSFPDQVVTVNLPFLSESITCMANKCTDELLTSVVDLITKERSQDTAIKIKLLSALLKGLVTRCHHLSNQITNHILKYFDTPGHEFLVADCIIECHELGPFEQDYLNINPFFHQKLFLDSLPSLLDRITAQSFGDLTVSQSSGDARRKAILGQLRFLPKNVIKTEVRRIQGIILTSLTDECLEIQMVSIQSLYDLLSENTSSFVINSLSTIVPRLLNISTASPKLDVRMKALECLTLVAKSVPEVHLLPIRSNTIKGIKSCLKDPKRLVRMAAAEASCRWTVIGQAGST